MTCAAQNNTNTYLNAGLGVSNWGIPVYIGYEFPIAQDINLGFGSSFRSKTRRFNHGFNESFKYTQTGIGFSGRGAYYTDRVLNIPEEFDVYGGVEVGFYIWSTKQKSSVNGVEFTSADPSSLSLGAFVGGRYFFKPNLAFNVEVGGGSLFSGGRVGISIVL